MVPTTLKHTVKAWPFILHYNTENIYRTLYIVLTMGGNIYIDFFLIDCGIALKEVPLTPGSEA